MLDKTKAIGVGAFALTLFLFAGCGRDKALDPLSNFVYDGPYPETGTVVADVTPAITRLQYFSVHIELSDPNLSMLPSRDAWTILGVTGTYTISDPSGSVLAPLPPLAQTTTAVVSSRSSLRYPITLLEKDWIDANCAGLIGTANEAVVTLNATMTVRRERDQMVQVINLRRKDETSTFTFTLKDSNQPAYGHINVP